MQILKTEKTSGIESINILARICWLWKGPTNNRGYGVVGVGDKLVLAHRLSWDLKNGIFPIQLLVCHRCDTPLCVNPKHLFLGSQKENMKDCAQKGRNIAQKSPWRMPRGGRQYSRTNPEKLARGCQNGMSKLTDQDVREIRSCHAPLKFLAQKFNLSYSRVAHIHCGEGWEHVK